MLPALEERLRRLPFDLRPLAAAVGRHYARGASIKPDGTVQVAPMPWVGPEAFAFVLYPPAEPAWLAAFARAFGRPIPDAYAAVLAAMNGCFAFGLALYGLPPSLQERPPRVDRGALEPLPLEAANRHWAREFPGAGAEFHIGGSSWTPTENVGYFLDAEGVLRSRRKTGEVLREWPSLRDLLEEELPAAETRDQERRPASHWPWESRGAPWPGPDRGRADTV